MDTWPALIAAVTDRDGRITGAQRTRLDPDGFTPTHLGKAPIATQRRAMDVMAAGEDIETTL